MGQVNSTPDSRLSSLRLALCGFGAKCSSLRFALCGFGAKCRLKAALISPRNLQEHGVSRIEKGSARESTELTRLLIKVVDPILH